MTDWNKIIFRLYEIEQRNLKPGEEISASLVTLIVKILGPDGLQRAFDGFIEELYAREES